MHPCPPQLQQTLPVHCCVQNLCGGVDVHLPSSDGFVMLDVGDEQQLINEAVSEQLLFQCSDGAQAVGGLREGFAPGPANGGVEVCGSGDLQEEEQQPWMQQLRLFHLPNGAQGSRLSDLRWDGVSQKQGQDGASSSGDDLHCSEFGCFDEDDFDRLAASLDVLESLVELLFDELSLASASQCCCCGGESGDGPLHKSEPPVRSVLCTHKPKAVECCHFPCDDFALDASCSPTLKDEKLGSCLPDLAGNSDKPTIFNRPFLIVDLGSRMPDSAESKTSSSSLNIASGLLTSVHDNILMKPEPLGSWSPDPAGTKTISLQHVQQHFFSSIESEDRFERCCEKLWTFKAAV